MFLLSCSCNPEQWQFFNSGIELHSWALPCLQPRGQFSQSTHQCLTVEKLSTRASLNLSIVNTWTQKNGPFTSKLWPGLTERFYNRVQLTLAALAQPSYGKPAGLLNSQEINQGGVFPQSCRFPLRREVRGHKISCLWFWAFSFFKYWRIPKGPLASLRRYTEIHVTLSTSYWEKCKD